MILLRRGMGMKIVVLPGVNVYKEKPIYDKFLSKITKVLKCDGEVFIWEKGWEHPTPNLPYKAIRNYVCGALLDFQQALKYFDIRVPEADIYLGHSAGSIIALAQKDTACVTFGSPAALVRTINIHELIGKDVNSIVATTELVNRMGELNRPVLNIINKHDIIAYPIDQSNVENFTYSTSGINPFTYSPITAHSNYWDNSKVINKIVATIKMWKSIQ